MSPEELGQYSILSRIGEGSFAHIYRAENTHLPPDHPLRCMAIKRFKPGCLEIGEQEARIMSTLFYDSGQSNGISKRNGSLKESPYSVRFHAGFLMNDSYLIMLELLDWSRQLSLTSLARVSPTLGLVGHEENPYKSLAKLAVQLLSGIVEIHDKGFVHCDLKPENIMYAGEAPSTRVKIIDFGNATRIKDLKEYADDFELQSLGYRAPEVLLGDPTFNEKIDVWSVGVILLERLINHIYKAFRNEWRLIFREGIDTCVIAITKVVEPLDVYGTRRTLYWKPEFGSQELIHAGHISDQSVMMQDLASIMCPEETSQLALDFLLCLLRVDHKKRWSAKEALRHPFLISGLQGPVWSQVLFPDAASLPPGDSQLKALNLI